MGMPPVGFKHSNRPRRSLVNASDRRDAHWQSAALLKSPQALKQRKQGGLRMSELALPQDQNVPSITLQPLQYRQVSFNIGLKLGRPEIDSCLGQDSIFTSSMAMPKTPMYKNTDPESRQYNIRFSRQVFAIKSEPVAMGVQKAPDCHFRLGALPFDASHHAGSCGAVDDIHLVLPQNSVVS
jgi:hypothetical protein